MITCEGGMFCMKEQVNGIGILAGEKLDEQMEDYNNAQLRFDKNAFIHRLFESQVRKTPDNIAVICKDEELTYSELNESANTLAHYLKKKGLKTGMLVGVCVHRSIDMIISLLGVLKAGGIYVPMDPTYPKERLFYMLEDSEMKFLITENTYLDWLNEAKVEIACIDSDKAIILEESKENLPITEDSDGQAYVIYTSGSTGNPKGVQISHRNLVNFLSSMKIEPGITDKDTLLAVTSFSFDISGLEMYLPLITGAKLVLASSDIVADSTKLAEYIEECEATVMQATPVTWRMLLDVGWKNKRDMKILCGGEALSANLAKELAHISTEIWNLYGPTETTIWSSIYRVKEITTNKVPIGKPIDNTKMYILDENMNPVPTGVIGELYISGEGVSIKGYLNREELTRERFMVDPFSNDGLRMYRTGDLARYLPDGNIEFLNRVDNQVKVRGFRIELGEIESTLVQCPEIKEAIVIAKENSYGIKDLVAYVFFQRDKMLTTGEMHEYLKTKLPEYMIPSWFIILDKIPLTLNGKIDKKSLPDPENTYLNSSEEYVAPRNEIEVGVSKIWGELLGIEHIGIDDNLFHMGGHSLIATQLVSRIRQLYQIEFPLNIVFEHPTIRAIANYIENCDEDIITIPDIERISRDEELPLSFSQERVWFIEQLNKDVMAYNFQSTLRIEGALDTGLLEKSLTEVIRRQEVYRTTFPSIDGRPYQLIHEPYSVNLPVIDITEVPKNQQRRVADEIIHEEIAKQFDLTKLPLARWVVIRLGINDHILLHIEHHTLHDGWSFRVFLRDLLKIYSAYKDGKESPLPELDIQFVDFSVWQRKLMSGERRDRQLEYWVNKLKGAKGVLEIPTDRPRPVAQTFKGAVARRVIPKKLCRDIRSLCREQGVTLFMVLMAAYNSLLYRYTSQEDIVVGSGIANRRTKETEKLYGMIVNNIAFRTDFTDNPTFRDILYSIRDQAIEAYENQDIPYDQVVDALHLERNMNMNPLFQVMFSFHDTRVSDFNSHGLNIELTEVISNGSAKFDMNVIVAPHSEIPEAMRKGKDEEELTLLWEYNSDLFNESTIECMIEHWINILKEVVNHIDVNVGFIDILSENEKHKIIEEWNETAADYPKDKYLNDLFEEQAISTPNFEAVVYGDEYLTYAELNEKANRLAHHLVELGVKPDVPVGICVERSLEMVVALMGVLKAGGAYVPIDTDIPIARKHQILKDAEAPVCISQKRLKSHLPTDAAIHFVYIDSHDLSHYPTTSPKIELQQDNLISIYYTSGSTGKPKGVCSTHVGWLNRMIWMQDNYQLQEGETVLQKTTLTFDDSAVEIFWPLIVGGRIAMMEPEEHKDPQAIIRDAGRYEAVVLQFVPSMLSLFIESITTEDKKKLNKLRHVISSGEALYPDLVRIFGEKLDNVSLNNQWGATEVSIDSTVYTCTSNDTKKNSIVSIGRPISNNKVYILDEHLQPVPIGVYGDLYLSGVGIALGYLNRLDLTRKAFIENPFEPEERMYKTGDRGKYLDNGLIVFGGREDEQVKIRGQRVELGEIESVLAKHPEIKRCVVAAHKHPDGYRINAYYIKKQDVKKVTTEKLHAFMANLLPQYMVPGRFIEMDSFPMTSSGKINRKLLIDPKDERPDLEQKYIKAKSETEKVLTRIWEEILGISNVGINDNFFELGGHSLDATRIVSRINKELEIKIPLKALFETLTVKLLAQRVDAQKKEQRKRNTQILMNCEAIPKVKQQESYKLSNAQKRYFFNYQFDETNALGFTYVDIIEGNLDRVCFVKALKEIVNRHSILRTTYKEFEGVPYQIIHEGIEIPCPYTDITNLSDSEKRSIVSSKINEEMKTPFDLLTGPIFRMYLYKMEHNKFLLIRSIYPIAYDSWSTTVFMKDLSDIYKILKQGESLEKLMPALQYVDFIAWQRMLLENGELDQQKAYWHHQLEGRRESVEFPELIDRKEWDNSLGVKNVVLDNKLVEKIKHFASAHKTTEYMTLLAGFNAWVFLNTGKVDVSICSPISGRTHPDLEDMLGVVVNPVVLRTSLKGNPSCTQILERVKKVAIDAYANQDYPFDLVVQDLREQEGTNSQLYSIVFVGQNAHNGFIQLDEETTLKRLHTIEDLLEADNLESPVADNSTEEVDIHIEMFNNSHEVSLRVQYNNKKFTDIDMDVFLNQYQVLLDEFVSKPETHLSQLGSDLIDENELFTI
ncbi:MAG: amino acid adenylation domain-containing protein [Firmicutes bacterium]|nr:amino acid adenylation domain-containing protein [Bacillota bacterium]